MTTFLEAFRNLRQSLASCYERSEADAVARHFLEAISGKSYSALLASDALMEEQTSQEWQQKSNELLAGRPLQQVLGFAFFHGRRFAVNEHTLIPRPETEELTDWIISEWKEKGACRLLDVGTGSGCIAITLSLELPQMQATAIDLSEEALKIARANNDALGAAVNFRQMDFISEKPGISSFDIVVSNPPYIPISEKEKLDKNVRDFEPGTALFVPDEDPLLFYRALAAYGNRLSAPPLIYCELHQDFAQQTALLFEEEGYMATLRSDLFGNQRMLRAEKNRRQ